MTFNKLLLWLLLIEPPADNTTLKGLEPSYRNLPPWGLLILFLAAAIVASVSLYLGERIDANRLKRLPVIFIMALCRTLVLFIIFLLLFRPVLVAEYGGERSRPIAVVIDHSQSLKQMDKRLTLNDKKRVAYALGLVLVDQPIESALLPSATPVNPDRITLVEGVFENEQLKLLEGLKRNGPVRIFTCGEKLAIVADDTAVDPKKDSNAPGAESGVTAKRVLEALARFKLTSHALAQLEKRDALPNAVASKLEPLLNLTFRTEQAFVAALGGRLNGDELAQYTAKILERAEAYESKTALWDQINDLLDRKDGDPPAAIVIISDGLDNSSTKRLGAVAERCKQAGVPLYIYGVGSAESGIFRIKNMDSPEMIFYDDKVDVTVRLRGQGFAKDARSRVILTVDGKQVAAEDVGLKQGEDTEKKLSFEWKKEGQAANKKLNLKAEAVVLGHEDTFRHSLDKPIEVVDKKLKVLYIENTPRWEYQFLQQAYLLRDRRVDAKFMLLKADKEALEPPGGVPGDWPYLSEFPALDALASFDLVILGDVPGEWLDQKVTVHGPGEPVTRLSAIKEFVKNGGGLIVIAGRRNMPACIIDNPARADLFAEVLPVELDPIDFKPQPRNIDLPELQRPQPYVPILTEEGEKSDMLTLADTPPESLEIWKKLPALHAEDVELGKKLMAEGRGFFWHARVKGLRAGATSLLAHPADKIVLKDRSGSVTRETPMPLLALQIYREGPVLFVATDESWRWRSNGNDRHLARLWGQIVYLMGAPHLQKGTARVRIKLQGGPQAELDRPSNLIVTVYDENYRPYVASGGGNSPGGKPLKAKLEFLDGKSPPEDVPLQPIPGPDGSFRSLLPHSRAGRVRVHMDPPDSGVKREEVTYEYQVNLPEGHELEPAHMALADLRDAADGSSGVIYSLDKQSIDRLKKDDVPDSVVKKLQKVTFESAFDIVRLAIYLSLAIAMVVLLALWGLTRRWPFGICVGIGVLLLGACFVIDLLVVSPREAAVAAEGRMNTEFKDESTFVAALENRLTKEELAEHKIKLLHDCQRGLAGKFYQEEDLYRLVNDIHPQKTTFTIPQEVMLLNPLTLIIIVLLVSAEWVTRKLLNLA